MLLEALAAVLLGATVVWLVFQPLVQPAENGADEYEEPLLLEETEKGQALLALKEIEFDRETGKLSDDDYQLLYNKYSARALELLRAETPLLPQGADLDELIAARVAALRSTDATDTAPVVAPTCPVCGPRPELDALWCSQCGQMIPGHQLCEACRSPMDFGARFCANCGVGAGGLATVGG